MVIPASQNFGEPMVRETVRIASRGDAWEGMLTIPAAAQGLVLFAGGSIDGRAPHHRYIADALQRAHFATLLFDVSATEVERRVVRSDRVRTDADAFARRLSHAIDWAAEHALTRSLPLGLFGTGNGAAAVLQSSVDHAGIHAVVGHMGRPDLARAALERVVAPVLLIVGGYDDQALETNRYAYARLARARRRKFVVVFGATPFSEEPGTLGDTARAAVAWFEECLTVAGAAAS